MRALVATLAVLWNTPRFSGFMHSFDRITTWAVAPPERSTEQRRPPDGVGEHAANPPAHSLLARWAELLRRPRALKARRRLTLVLPVLAVWLLFVVTGLRGVDFGFHWDEVPWHVTPVREAVSSGILLPRSYIYPMLIKWLVLAPSLVAGMRAGLETAFEPGAMQAAMVAAINAPDYLLSARAICIVVSSFAILWTYGAALAFRMRWWVALVAASGLGLSWEFAYHSRFLATDALNTQFAALVVFLLALYLRHGRVRWLYAASAAAGLATGTKYTGLGLLLPVLLSSLLHRQWKRGHWELALLAETQRAVLLCTTALLAYLVTTPSTLLDPFRFIAETRWISKLYQGTHGGYTAESGWDHARIVVEFLGLGYYSRYKLVAAPLFVISLVGAGLWVRRDRGSAAVLAIFPVLFLIAFCAKYRIVTVRNYLFVAPFLSLFMARAFSDFADRLARPWSRTVLAVALAALGFVQASWLVRAGESLRHVDPARYVRQALAHVTRHPETRFLLSPRVQSLAKSQKLTLPSNVTKQKNPDEVVFFARAEGPDGRIWKSNDPFQARAVFGPGEVNFDWYSSWWGHDRVVVMTLEKARATKVPLSLQARHP